MAQIRNKKSRKSDENDEMMMIFYEIEYKSMMNQVKISWKSHKSVKVRLKCYKMMII